MTASTGSTADGALLRAELVEVPKQALEAVRGGDRDQHSAARVLGKQGGESREERHVLADHGPDAASSR